MTSIQGCQTPEAKYIVTTTVTGLCSRMDEREIPEFNMASAIYDAECDDRMLSARSLRTRRSLLTRAKPEETWLT